jgi:hypothetical protein
MRPTLLICTLFLAFAVTSLAKPMAAQDGRFARGWRPRAQARAEKQQNARKNADGKKPGPNSAAKPKPKENPITPKPPGERALAGLPGPWVQRLKDMPPDQRERFLQNNQRFQSLPPEQQQRIRQNLQNYDRLTPEQKHEIEERGKIWNQMTPEQREHAKNDLLPKWQSMPVERRQMINRRLRVLHDMSPEDREAAMNDPRFMRGLTPDEQSMLRELNGLRNPAAAPQAQPQP